MKKLALSSLAAASMALPLSSLHAAALASDNAANYTSFGNGSNAGTGFGSFTLTNNGTGNTGSFLGDSTQNARGNPDYPGGINSANGTAFGVYGNSGGQELAARSFTADAQGQIALSVGQSFSLSFDNGYVNNGSTVGFNLLNTAGTSRFTFQFIGGQNTYVYNTGGTSTNTSTGVNYTGNGLNIVFTQSAANAFTVGITSGGTTTTLNGTLSASDISQVQFFDNNAGTGSNYDVYFNNLAVVPEPGTLAVVALGLGGLGLVVRRRRRA